MGLAVHVHAHVHVVLDSVQIPDLDPCLSPYLYHFHMSRQDTLLYSRVAMEGVVVVVPSQKLQHLIH